MDRAAAVQLLRENAGFDDPEAWAEFAIRHKFQPIRAVRIAVCPDCGSPPLPPLGQFIYYSSLCRLVECSACRLIYSDVILDQAVVESHFALAYKEEDYFDARRRPVFEHLCRLIDQVTGPGGRVLDVGGAKGHLMSRLRTRRADIAITVSDLSSEACDHARNVFGFATILGDVRALGDAGETWDVLVLSDVLYYERRLRLFWELLPRLLRPGGSVVIRVPNKVGLVRLGQALWRRTHSAESRSLQSSVPFFNPEHSFVLTRRYLAHRLRRLGCRRVVVHPSPLLGPVGEQRGLRLAGVWGRAASFQLAQSAATLTGGRVIATPGMVVVGTGFHPVPA